MSDIKPWKTLQTDTVYENERFKVNKDICQLPDGMIMQNYFITEGKDSVIVFCVNKGGEVVLVRQYRQGSKDTTLELPGGLIERHDINPTEAARRELLEETGYSSEVMDPLATWSVNPAETANKVSIFFAPESEKISSTKFVIGEVTETVTVSPTELLTMIANNQISSLPHIAAIYQGLIKLGAIKA